VRRDGGGVTSAAGGGRMVPAREAIGEEES
jgi:hypothetical protein